MEESAGAVAERGRLAQFPDEPTAGTFAWPADDTCVIKLCAYETPFETTFTLKFDGEHVTLNSEANVAFGDQATAASRTGGIGICVQECA